MDMIGRLKNNELMRKRRGKYLRTKILYEDIARKREITLEKASPAILAEIRQQVQLRQRQTNKRNLAILILVTLLVVFMISLLFIDSWL